MTGGGLDHGRCAYPLDVLKTIENPVENRPSAGPIAPKPRPFYRKWLFWATALLVFVAIGAAAVRWIVWPELQRWQPQVEAQLGKVLGTTVTIGKIEASFAGIYPQLTAFEVTSAKGEISLSRVEMEFSLRAILAREVLFRRLVLDSGKLSIDIDSKGLWHFAGLVFDPTDQTSMDAQAQAKLSATVRWFLLQRKLQVSNVVVEINNPTAGRRDAISISDVSLDNQGRLHSIVARTQPGGEIKATWRHPVGVASHLAMQWAGETTWSPGLGKEALFKGDLLAYLLDISGALTKHPMLDQIQALQLSGQASAKFAKGVVNQAEFQNLNLRSSTLLTMLEADKLTLTRTGGQNFDLEVKKASMIAEGELKGLSVATTGPSKISFHWGAEELGFERATLQSAELSLGALDLSLARRAFRHWSDAQDLVDLKSLASFWGLENWNFGGTINSTRLRWAQAAALFEGEVQAKAVSLVAIENASDKPSFDNLGGKLSFSRVTGSTDLKGSFEVSGNQSTVNLPNLLAESKVQVATLKGNGLWYWFRDAGASGTKFKPGVELTIESLALSNADATVQAKGIYRSSRELNPLMKSPGFLDLSGNFVWSDGARLARYLPQKINENARGWVERAILAGNASGGTFKVRGDLYNFPFRSPEEGDFFIRTQVHDVRLAYAPNWPDVEHIEGDFSIDRASIKLTSHAAEIMGVPVSNVLIDIPDVRTGLVKIQGDAQGDATKMLSFVNTSPLKRFSIESDIKPVQEFMSSLKIDGPAKLTLAIDLPIGDLANLKVHGSVDVKEARFQSIHTPDLSEFSGTLLFSEKDLEFKQLQGRFQKEGFLQIEGVSNQQSPLALKVSGVATAAALQDLRALEAVKPVTAHFSGSTKFQSSIEVRNQQLEVQLQSDLVGMAVGLPIPAGKPAEVARDLKLVYTPVSMKIGMAATSIDSPTVGISLSRATSEAISPWSGGISVGLLATDVMPRAETGIDMLARSPSLDVGAWRDWIGATFGAGSNSGGAQTKRGQNTLIGLPAFLLGGSLAAVNSLAIVADQVLLDDLIFKDVTLGAGMQWSTSPVNSIPTLESWQASAVTSNANGFLRWEDKGIQGELTAHLARLDWPLLRSPVGLQTSSVDQRIERLPSLKLIAERFKYKDMNLGALTLDANAIVDGFDLSKIKVVAAGFTVDAAGAWRAASNTTQLTVAIKSSDSGVAFTGLGYSGVLKEAAGDLTGELRWRGRPDFVDLKILDGELTLALDKGQFLKTSSSAAKLLGLVNSQGLLRRLNLDFRDVVGEGFAFDSIRGPIKLVQGVATSDEVIMKGPQAQVLVRGSVRLDDQTQILVARVLPEINAGGASIAYAAIVNPALGLGSFVVQWLLRKPLQEIFASEYDVTGTWGQPVVSDRPRRSKPEVQTQTAP
jgi:uncharacterized protein (TIGR02099 family)